MFLALDIGNSATKLGLHDGISWVRVQRFDSESGMITEQLLTFVSEMAIYRAGIASVVPDRSTEAAVAIREQLGITPSIITPALPLPFRMGYETPETLGADRLAAASAAWFRFGRNGQRPVIAIDAGTAVTTEVVSADGKYLGGAIAPGPDAIRRALVRDTAQLPEVSWPAVPEAIGSSTHAAISAGVSVMFLDGVRGLLDRSSDQVTGAPFVVATGGWAAWLDRHLDTIDLVEPNLVLDGIRLLAS